QRWVVTAGKGGAVRLWPTPAPFEGAPPQVGLWAQVLTRMGLDPGGGVQGLGAPARHERRQRLPGVGGSPIPRGARVVQEALGPSSGAGHGGTPEEGLT